MSCKHKTLKSAAPKSQRWHYTVVDSEGKSRAPRCEHTTNHQTYSPVAINFAWSWWSPMASEALSYGLNSKIFLGEHAPRPPYKALRYRMRAQQTALAARAAWPHQPHSVYTPPPFFNVWIRPWVGVVCSCLPAIRVMHAYL